MQRPATNPTDSFPTMHEIFIIVPSYPICLSEKPKGETNKDKIWDKMIKFPRTIEKDNSNFRNSLLRLIFAIASVNDSLYVSATKLGGYCGFSLKNTNTGIVNPNVQ